LKRFIDIYFLILNIKSFLLSLFLITFFFAVIHMHFTLPYFEAPLCP